MVKLLPNVCTLCTVDRHMQQQLNICTTSFSRTQTNFPNVSQTSSPKQIFPKGKCDRNFNTSYLNWKLNLKHLGRGPSARQMKVCSEMQFKYTMLEEVRSEKILELDMKESL